MANLRAGGEKIRSFILDHLAQHPRDIVRVTAQKFGITRQAVNRHLRNLIAEKTVLFEGATFGRKYRLAPLLRWRHTYRLIPPISEDAAWRDVAPHLGQLPENLMRLWQYGFSEMFNNVIDHSGGKRVTVALEKTAASTEVSISDDGVGIFRKIQAALNLLDERHAVLELAKGKFTTDPTRHTGEGIFFTSRSFDSFEILSGDVFFRHPFHEPKDWILDGKSAHGTVVWMSLHNHTARTLKSIFDQFSSGEDYAFTKTVVPVVLAQYGDDSLVSRSQAKRLLARIDRFQTVVLDFAGVASIGPAFADEIFRVFRQQHPEMRLRELHANSEVAKMIARARGPN